MNQNPKIMNRNPKIMNQNPKIMNQNPKIMNQNPIIVHQKTTLYVINGVWWTISKYRKPIFNKNLLKDDPDLSFSSNCHHNFGNL